MVQIPETLVQYHQKSVWKYFIRLLQVTNAVQRIYEVEGPHIRFSEKKVPPLKPFCFYLRQYCSNPPENTSNRFLSKFHIDHDVQKNFQLNFFRWKKWISKKWKIKISNFQIFQILYEDDFVKVGRIGKYHGLRQSNLASSVDNKFQETSRSTGESRDRDLQDKKNPTKKYVFFVEKNYFEKMLVIFFDFIKVRSMSNFRIIMPKSIKRNQQDIFFW